MTRTMPRSRIVLMQSSRRAAAVYAPFLSTHDCRPNSFATRRMKGSEIFMSLCSWARVYSTAAALALRLYLSLRRDLFAAFINLQLLRIRCVYV